MNSKKTKKIYSFWLLVVVIIFLFTNLGKYIQAFNRNILSTNLYLSLISDSQINPIVNERIDKYSNDECLRSWLKGYVAQLEGNLKDRQIYWLKTIKCSSEYVGGVYREAMDDRELAEAAVQYHPESSMNWFWLASLTEDPQAAIPLYIQTVIIDPHFGLAWYRLGEKQELVQQNTNAIDSFLESSKYLNEGSDFYVRIGRIMENLGDTNSAIYYYRLSIYEDAHNRADELESKLLH